MRWIQSHTLLSSICLTLGYASMTSVLKSNDKIKPDRCQMLFCQSTFLVAFSKSCSVYGFLPLTFGFPLLEFYGNKKTTHSLVILSPFSVTQTHKKRNLKLDWCNQSVTHVCVRESSFCFQWDRGRQRKEKKVQKWLLLKTGCLYVLFLHIFPTNVVIIFLGLSLSWCLLICLSSLLCWVARLALHAYTWLYNLCLEVAEIFK